MTIRRAVAVITICLAVLLGYLVAWPVDIDPLPFEPEESPEMEGALEPNQDLRRGERVAEGKLVGPEDTEVDSRGRIYGGTADGRIVRIDPDTEEVETFARTGGRPLGMIFDDGGYLVTCVAGEGLLRIDPDGNIEPLVTEVDGSPLEFANDLDIAADGTIYFSEASRRFGFAEYEADILEARPHGRLLRYDPDRDDVEVVADGFYFANGVAISEDETFVAVAETARYRVRRYWLEGEKAGTVDVMADNLVGFPDNLNRSSNGTFWLAIFTLRNPALDRVHRSPFAKRVVYRLPSFLQPRPEPYGLVVELDEDGEILRSFHDPGGEVFSGVTSAKERDGALYFGTLEQEWLGRMEL